jgi:hypothetical protein
MGPDELLGQAHVLLVAGKGGVGKTTVSAALARRFADAGRKVLLVTLEDTPALPLLFGRDVSLGYEDVVLYEAAAGSGRVSARVLTPDDALLEYLADHGLRRVAKRLVASGVLEVVSTAVPGIREILVLGKVKQLERVGTHDLIVVDAPAAGHAVSLLTSPAGLLDAARAGPLHTQARDVVEMLRDPRRAMVVLVTLPEETPVNEVVETAFRLEDEVGVALGAVVVNACSPPCPGLDADPTDAARAAGATPLSEERAEALARAARFRRHREALEAAQLERLARELPLPQLRLPHLFRAELGPDDLALLATALGDALAATPAAT